VHFTTLIQRWFRLNKRDLPWRETSDPYLIWLSEVILQQTRIEQGLPYFLKFSRKYPTVRHLATAPEDEVLNLWQGLGYYSRARNLQAGARYIVDFHFEKFPGSYDEILKIKGVGAYTAAAIASIAFKLPHAVVDGNVYRVLSRVFKIAEPIDSTSGKKIIAAAAYEILDKKNPGDHNQALMEIGSLVCTPKSPRCESCPVQVKCLSYADGTFLNYPVKEKKIKVRDRFFHYLVITDGKKTILKKRPPKDIWQGLYDFPLIEKKSAGATIKADMEVLKPKQVLKEATFVHILSHQKIHATFWKLKVAKPKPRKGEVLVDWQNLDDFPMPQLLIRYLEQTGG
jgi:A/G-specific adenine glycosylase